MKQVAPAAERNKGPLADVYARVLPAGGLALEVASGTGQHVAWFAARMAALTWQPSDLDDGGFASIRAWCEGLPNVRAPIVLDAAAPSWPVERADAVVCANMVHIAPWAAAVGLFAGAGRILPAGGVLCTYGPYRFGGAFTAASNAAFDASLRARDPAWGVRDVDALRGLADAAGLALEETIAMPANNHVLVWRRVASRPPGQQT